MINDEMPAAGDVKFGQADVGDDSTMSLQNFDPSDFACGEELIIPTTNQIFSSTGGSSTLEEILHDADAELLSAPKPLSELLSETEIAGLFHHMHNGNECMDFAMSFRGDNGATVYAKSATKRVDQTISWSIATMLGRSKPGREMSFVPYATNEHGCSRWAAMDFDAHNGEIRRAYTFARDAYLYFRSKRPEGIVVFLEHTGTGGWHLWLLSREFHPCTKWTALLRGAAGAIGAPIQSGICELFPNE